jgi:hypothetical protein
VRDLLLHLQMTNFKHKDILVSGDYGTFVSPPQSLSCGGLLFQDFKLRNVDVLLNRVVKSNYMAR